MHVECLVTASAVSSTGVWLDMSSLALPHRQFQGLLPSSELCGTALIVGSQRGHLAQSEIVCKATLTCLQPRCWRLLLRVAQQTTPYHVLPNFGVCCMHLLARLSARYDADSLLS